LVALFSVLQLTASRIAEAKKEREETDTSEPESSIIRRKQIEAFKDPKYRKKYGHLFDLDRLEEAADTED